MKVLLLVHGLPIGGTETMVCHLARRLRASGIEARIGCLDLVGELGEALKAEGFRVELLGRKPGFDPRTPFRIARLVRRGGIDVVHAHQYTCFFYAALAKLLVERPLVFTEHGRFFPDLPSARRRAFNFLFRRKADRVTAVSRGVRESLRAVEGFDANSIEVIYNGIDVARSPRRTAASAAEARKRLGIAEGTRVIGTVGRLDPIKNQRLLIEAFALLPRGRMDLALAIVGDGPERQALESLARGLGVQDRTYFLGARRDVGDLLPAFDVFALSSLSEGTPMTLIEAMAAAVPIVSTAVGGIPEIIEDGKEGLLVPETGADRRDAGASSGSGPAQRFAETLERVLADSILTAKLARRGMERAARDFSLDAICERYLQVYRELAPATASEKLLVTKR